MTTMEKLTHQKKADLKQLIHNVLHSTRLNNTITEIIIEQMKKLNLESDIIKEYEIVMKLKIRDIEMKNNLGVHLM